MTTEFMYIGVEYAQRADWQEYMPEVVAPRNYKKPETIEAYLQEAQARQFEEAVDDVLAGQPSKVLVTSPLSPGNHMAFTEATKLLAYLGEYRLRTMFVGFKPKQLFQRIALQAVVEGSKLPLWLVDLDMSIHEHQIKFLNPIRSFFGTSKVELDRIIKLGSLLSLPGLEGEPPSALWQISFLRELTDRMIQTNSDGEIIN